MDEVRLWKDGKWNFLENFSFGGKIHSVASYASDGRIAVGGNFSFLLQKNERKEISFFAILVYPSFPFRVKFMRNFRFDGRQANCFGGNFTFLMQKKKKKEICFVNIFHSFLPSWKIQTRRKKFISLIKGKKCQSFL